MTVRDEIRDFLLSRRARISPEQAGLPRHGDRRVAGLRREEVAQLAGISVEYYTRLERGNARGYSTEVLEAVCRALQLNDAEREHLFDLVQTPAAPDPASTVRPGLQRLLDAMTTTPAYIWNRRLDIVAANPLGRALFAPLFDSALFDGPLFDGPLFDGPLFDGPLFAGPLFAGPHRPVNQARFLFLDPSAPVFFPEWELLTHDAVAVLRTTSGRQPGDDRLASLVAELAAASPAFHDLWSEYDVRHRRTGVKHFNHPVAGPMTVDFESMTLPTHPGLRLSAGTAEPGSPSAAALQFLANWAPAMTTGSE
ncbi:helix-turn-helix domain-containing protein [Actinoplanes sp. CA-015351]|uniref:helix-turn-helix domain-containing protein n=1 Tax=Actinoplanes sp. CA-015351 TaxID=3239897 RepID=UPI003D96B5C4